MTDASGPADDLCLSYVNTRYWRGSPSPTESLHAIGDVTGWVAENVPGVAPFAAACAARWAAQPQEGVVALAAAVGLREVLHTVLGGVAGGAAPELSGLNLALAQAAPRRRLVCDGGTCAWEAEPAAPSAARLLSAVLWSAADLLAGARRARLRACANPKCGWLFLDDSKSANRRWCAMSTCGNRAKAQRHYLKTKGSRVGEGAGSGTHLSPAPSRKGRGEE